MIPADHFIMNPDGTAWLVMPADPITDGIPDWWVALDRPCDHCKGTGAGRNRYKCSDCAGTGRHTFTVEVEFVTDDPVSITTDIRVSVVPGMVLPITGEMDGGPLRIERVEGYQDEMIGPDDQFIRDVTLPPAAKPGMWCVQVKIAS
jgi:hypothetical protein